MKIFIVFTIAMLSLSFYTIDWEQEKSVGDKIELGQKLFFAKILSLDQSIACSSCHKPAFAFADTVAFSKGVFDSLGTRNTPSVMNMSYRSHFFYDGRAASLEEQAIVPIESKIEMHLDFDLAVERVRQNPEYKALFQETYSTLPDSTTILNALAEFVRSLESDGSAPYDRWANGEEEAMSESQLRGKELFVEKGKCFDCHYTGDFTGDEFRNIGLFDGEKLLDTGRFGITKDSTDLGKFKVPGLRNVALTAPYMHNGQFQTLEEVIDYYDNPFQFVPNPINMDDLMIEPLNLTDQEKKDIINFLHALTDESFSF